MTWKEFILELLGLISADITVAFILYLIWKYIDLKYFSSLEITSLREENNYLKKENKKIHGTSTEFWTEEDMK